MKIGIVLKIVSVIILPFLLIGYYLLFSKTLLFVAPNIKTDDLIALSLIIIVIVIGVIVAIVVSDNE